MKVEGGELVCPFCGTKEIWAEGVHLLGNGVGLVWGNDAWELQPSITELGEHLLMEDVGSDLMAGLALTYLCQGDGEISNEYGGMSRANSHKWAEIQTSSDADGVQFVSVLIEVRDPVIRPERSS